MTEPSGSRPWTVNALIGLQVAIMLLAWLMEPGVSAGAVVQWVASALLVYGLATSRRWSLRILFVLSLLSIALGVAGLIMSLVAGTAPPLELAYGAALSILTLALMLHPATTHFFEPSGSPQLGTTVG